MKIKNIYLYKQGLWNREIKFVFDEGEVLSNTANNIRAKTSFSLYEDLYDEIDFNDFRDKLCGNYYMQLDRWFEEPVDMVKVELKDIKLIKTRRWFNNQILITVEISFYYK